MLLSGQQKLFASGQKVALFEQKIHSTFEVVRDVTKEFWENIKKRLVSVLIKI